jgi:hypothetical protein
VFIIESLVLKTYLLKEGEKRRKKGEKKVRSEGSEGGTEKYKWIYQRL